MPRTRTLAVVALAVTGLFASAASAQTTRTVCASGCQYTSINAAIDAASDGDVIQLSAETYTEGAVIDTDGKAITLRGTTSKDGDPTSILDGGDAHRVLVCESGEGAGTVFEDLVIQRGYPTFSEGSGGGGMNILNASPTLRRCVFQSNRALSFAAALNAYYSDSQLIDCRFSNNSADNTGAIYWWFGSPTLESCVFESNSGRYGAGVYMDECAMTLDGCEFTGNVAGYETRGGAGGAVYLDRGATPTFRDCLFSGNQAIQDEGEGGAVFCDESAPTFERCTFTGNSAGGEGGGAIHNDEGSTTLTDCYFCGNLNGSGFNSISGDAIDGSSSGNTFNNASCADADEDGVPDVWDVCSNGDDTIDSDGDGTPDACDNCPGDPLKTEPGDCGCGVVDTNVYGDVDCDGDYDEDDIRAGMVAFGITEGTPGDMDGDGDVDAEDFVAVRNQIGVDALGCLVADINGDGEVDGADFAYVLGYWGVCSAP